MAWPLLTILPSEAPDSENPSTDSCGAAPGSSERVRREQGGDVEQAAGEVVWNSEAMRRVQALIDQVADTDATVLVEGESGVGKSLVAHALHAQSARRDRPLVKVNCPALPSELLESELFGYERGAFTGAHRRKPGKFELADGGTLVLDEVGEIPLPLQAKLLHVLQDRSFARLGGTQDISVDVRVIGASNRDLAHAVRAGLFREDLYYRMNVVHVAVPPLRERREEIPGLIDHFLQKYARRYGRPPRPLAPPTVARLMAHPWPGNIRELENTVKRLLLLGEEAVLRALKAVPPGNGASVLQGMGEEATALHPWDLKAAARRAAREAERALILQALQIQGWNKMAAARRLQVSYRALLYKIRAHGLDRRAQDCGDRTALARLPSVL